MFPGKASLLHRTFCDLCTGPLPCGVEEGFPVTAEGGQAASPRLEPGACFYGAPSLGALGPRPGFGVLQEHLRRGRGLGTGGAAGTDPLAPQDPGHLLPATPHGVDTLVQHPPHSWALQGLAGGWGSGHGGSFTWPGWAWGHHQLSRAGERCWTAGPFLLPLQTQVSGRCLMLG